MFVLIIVITFFLFLRARLINLLLDQGLLLGRIRTFVLRQLDGSILIRVLINIVIGIGVRSGFLKSSVFCNLYYALSGTREDRGYLLREPDLLGKVGALRGPVF